MGWFGKHRCEITENTSVRAVPSALTATATRFEVVALERRSFTAAELAPLVRRSARAWGSDARLYLIISDAMGHDGFADDWDFHVLFPTLRAEGRWTLGPSEDGESAVLFAKIAPVPEPGTTEYLMAQISPQLVNDQQQAWDLRLRLLRALPEEFIDSPSVAAAIERADPMAWASGAMRLKGRTLPTGTAVWEWASNDVYHVPFALTGSPATALAARPEQTGGGWGDPPPER